MVRRPAGSRLTDHDIATDRARATDVRLHQQARSALERSATVGCAEPLALGARGAGIGFEVSVHVAARRSTIRRAAARPATGKASPGATHALQRRRRVEAEEAELRARAPELNARVGRTGIEERRAATSSAQSATAAGLTDRRAGARLTRCAPLATRRVAEARDTEPTRVTAADRARRAVARRRLGSTRKEQRERKERPAHQFTAGRRRSRR